MTKKEDHYIFLRVHVATPQDGVAPTREGVERWIRDMLCVSQPSIEPDGGWYVERAETFDAEGKPRIDS